MAHPYSEHRQHKVEQSRVSHITKGYASGGAVHSDAAADKKMIDAAVHKHEKHMHKGEPETKLATGGKVKGRLDRYARGGKVKSKGATNVNVIIAPQGGSDQPPANVPPLGAGVPTPPVAAPPPPPVPPAAMRPPMMPPGMPVRARGGRIKDGPAYKEGIRNGTQVQHTDGKNDGKDIYRGRQITYALGGKIEAGNERGPKMRAGADSGEGRLEKTALQRRSKRP